MLTGKVLLHLALRGTVSWEDDRHLLVEVGRSTDTSLRQGLLRVAVDGTAEWALPWRDTRIVAGRPLYGPHPVVRAD